MCSKTAVEKKKIVGAEKNSNGGISTLAVMR